MMNGIFTEVHSASQNDTAINRSNIYLNSLTDHLYAESSQRYSYTPKS